jgi:hypothetical protein
MLALGFVGVTTDWTNGIPIRIPASIRPFMLDGSESIKYWRERVCQLEPDQDASNFASECAGNGSRPLLLIWGDSYAASLYPGLARFADEKGFELAQFTASACPPLIGYINPDRRFCKSINDYVQKRIFELHPDTVILYSSWSYHHQSTDFQHDLAQTVSLLKPLTKKIVVVGPVASWLGPGLPGNVLDYYFESGNFSVLPERTWYRSNENWTKAAEAMVEPTANALGVEYISARKILCNEAGCLARIGSNGADLVTFDNGHLSYPGSIFLAGQMIGRILDVKR